MKRVDEFTRAGGHIGGAIAARNADDQASRSPLLDGMVEEMPQRPGRRIHRLKRRGRAGEQIPGGDTYSPAPEVEREQDVAVGSGGQFRPPAPHSGVTHIT